MNYLTATAFFILAITLFHFLHSCVHWSSTFNFLQELVLCFHNLATCLAQETQLLAYLSFQHAFLTKA